ncbi:zinc metalloprotease [Tautonia plasticadhaerens]|uniref:ATP-dependent zinc metalloprotease FtsH n=1 Tax=Tautonia plasticadhaerens TaxID=2527974 RepID=A0A518H9Q7_9BACT|nr:hypothetical protein [Tautonia plasticadhaerens]QDV37581.1 hypothetical protein ElP_55210 [Tautonia plasticadhaerens]
MSLYEIAVHEAAHAVLAWATGRPILGLAMVSDEEYARLRRRPRSLNSWGQAYYPGPPAWASKDRHSRPLADREAMVGMAGDLAVRLYRGTPLRKEPTETDLDPMVHAAALAAEAGEDVEAHMKELASKTVLVLNTYWDRLLGLADELLDKRKLTGPEIKALLQSPRPSS